MDRGFASIMVPVRITQSPCGSMAGDATEVQALSMNGPLCGEVCNEPTEQLGLVAISSLC